MGEIDNAEQFKIMEYMRKIIALQKENLDLQRELIARQEERIALLEASEVKKTIAPVLQLVKKPAKKGTPPLPVGNL